MTFVTVCLAETNQRTASDLDSKFKNSKIERRLKNGEVQSFDGNKYKIVLIKRSPRQPKTITKIITKRIYTRKPERLNSVSLHLGADLWGSESFGGVGGFSYSRRILEDIRVTGTGLSNGVFLGGIGFDF